MKVFHFIVNVLFSIAMVPCIPFVFSASNILSEIFHDAIAVESFIALLLSSFCLEHSIFVQVFNKNGLIYTFLPIPPYILD